MLSNALRFVRLLVDCPLAITPVPSTGISAFSTGKPGDHLTDLIQITRAYQRDVTPSTLPTRGQLILDLHQAAALPVAARRDLRATTKGGPLIISMLEDRQTRAVASLAHRLHAGATGHF